MAQQLMQYAEKYNHLAEEQHSGQYGRTGTNKTLLMLVSHRDLHPSKGTERQKRETKQQQTTQHIDQAKEP
eukprot:7776396-Ditylum_brightwellii.AAC.1